MLLSCNAGGKQISIFMWTINYSIQFNSRLASPRNHNTHPPAHKCDIFAWICCLDDSRTRLLGLAQFCVLHKWHMSSSDGISCDPVIEIIKASLYCACIAVQDLLLPGITTPIHQPTSVTYLPGFIVLTTLSHEVIGPCTILCSA